MRSETGEAGDRGPEHLTRPQAGDQRRPPRQNETMRILGMGLPPDLQAKYGRDEEYRKWAKEMPSVPFRQDWRVTILPPFAGAAVRFIVERGNARVSVYADFDESLGFYGGKPYWEIYPLEDDVWRCDIRDTQSLCEHIEMSLKSQLTPE